MCIGNKLPNSLIFAVKETISKTVHRNFAANTREKFWNNNPATAGLYRQEKPQGRKEGPVIEPHMINILRYPDRFGSCLATLFVYTSKNNKVGRPDNHTSYNLITFLNH